MDELISDSEPIRWSPAAAWAFMPPPPKWEFSINGDWQQLTVQLPDAPNWFHRWAQRVILGIDWGRIPKTEQPSTE